MELIVFFGSVCGGRLMVLIENCMESHKIFVYDNGAFWIASLAGLIKNRLLDLETTGAGLIVYLKKSTTFALEMKNTYQHSTPSFGPISDRHEAKLLAGRHGCGRYRKDFKQDL